MQLLTVSFLLHTNMHSLKYLANYAIAEVKCLYINQNVSIQCCRYDGSPRTVVDEPEPWVELADLDGSHLAQLVNPGLFEDIVIF